MERYKLKTMLMSEEDLRVLLESLDCSCENDELPDQDRARIVSLRERLCEQFHMEAKES